MTREEYDDFLDGMTADTEEFARDFAEEWNEVIADFTDRFFDWDAAWDDYETVTALSTRAMTKSIDNWVTDQRRVLDASLFVYENYGQAAGELFDTLPEDLAAHLAAALAKDPKIFIAQFEKILTADQILLGFAMEKFLASLPAGAQKGLDAWNAYFDSTVEPALLESGEEGGDAWVQGLEENYLAWRNGLVEESPALAGAFNTMLLEAISTIDEFSLLDIAAITADMTTTEKLLFFTGIGVEWRTAIALAFASLPELLGDIATEAGIKVNENFELVEGIQSPSKVFMKMGRQIAEGFRIGVSDMGKIMETAGMDVSRSFNPVVPQSATSITRVTNINIDHPNHPTDDITKDLQRASVLAGFQRMAEVGSINNS
jgi:hypothetical protein